MSKPFPDITWPVFEVCNANKTKAFEDMTRKLFNSYLAGNQTLVSDGINPGIEVLPVLEPEAKDDAQRRWISFQSKYFEKNTNYKDILDSAKQIVKHYKGKLDLVYLFCNNSLKISCDGYKSVKNLLAEAGIELHPITNEMILDLVSKYPEIYNYYFRPRDIPDCSHDNQSSFTIDQIVYSLKNSLDAGKMPPQDPALLVGLIQEKLDVCRGFVLNMELDQLKQELEKLFSHDLCGVEGSDTLLFYQNILNIHERKPIQNTNTDLMHNAEIEWLKAFYENTYAISFEEFNKYSDEIRILVIDQLFVTKHWNTIISLHDQSLTLGSAWEQMELYYGLSLFNLQRYEEASAVLHGLFEKTKCPAHEMYSKFADIQVINSLFRTGVNANADMLAELVSSLDAYKCIKQYQASDLLIALLTLESYCYLGLSKKEYLEKAISTYDSFSESVRLNDIVRFYYALSVELNGNIDKALELYETMEWKDDETIAYRYLFCLIMIGQTETAYQKFYLLHDVAKTERIYALSLLALHKTDVQMARSLAKKWLEGHSSDFLSIVSFIVYVEDREIISSLIMPQLHELMTTERISCLPFRQRIELIIWLAQNIEIELMEQVLKTIDDVNNLNESTIVGIYRSLAAACEKPNVFINPILEPTTIAKSIETITDRFLNAGINRELFLRIKIACVNARQSYISALQYSKELFELTQDETTAKNIISILVLRKDSNETDYHPYIDILKDSEEPDQCITVAAGLLMIGKEQEADLYAYKAIYYLNGKDDFSIYNSFFQLDSFKMRWLQEDEVVPIRSSKGNVIVTLEASSSTTQEAKMDVCLDSEKEFSQDGNRSMGVCHINSTDTDYLKIKSAGLNQVIKLKNGTFQVKRIIPRKKFCRAFVFSKLQANQEYFSGVIISTLPENPKEAIEQLRKLSDRSEQANTNLKMYHFEDSTNLGLPIEVVGFMDYDRYLGTSKYLLFQPDEAFYSGEVVYRFDSGEGLKYVITLSTLVLLSILNRLDVLDVIKQNIIIPKSYLPFFHDLFEKALNDQAMDAKTLYFDGDKTILSDQDPTIPEIWERIVRFCDDCETYEIIDQERIDYYIQESLRGEDLLSAFKLNVIQLDALILSSRESAMYLCDDLFFRKLANWAGIKHCNTASLLLLHDDQEYIDSFVKELSKTNYIYVPLAGVSFSTIQAMQDDMLTGKRKKELNAGWIHQYYAAREAVLNELIKDELFHMQIVDNTDESVTDDNS